MKSGTSLRPSPRHRSGIPWSTPLAASVPLAAPRMYPLSACRRWGSWGQVDALRWPTAPRAPGRQPLRAASRDPCSRGWSGWFGHNRAGWAMGGQSRLDRWTAETPGPRLPHRVKGMLPVHHRAEHPRHRRPGGGGQEGQMKTRITIVAIAALAVPVAGGLRSTAADRPLFSSPRTRPACTRSVPIRPSSSESSLVST